MRKILLILLISSLFSLSTEDVYDNSWALIVGIDKYEYVKNLDYAVEDAKSIKELLINNFQFPDENIIFLLDEEATYMKIKKSLSKIIRNAGENDRILIFFAGHGLTLDLPESGEMGFLIPVDGDQDDLYGTSLGMDQLRKVSSLSEAKHMLYLVDACYGGLAAENTRGLPIHTPGFLNKITEDKSRQIITAGGRDEPAIEKAEWGHSAFTLNVIRGLKDGAADLNYDGMITGEELGSFLETRVKIDSDNKQTPQVRRFTSHEGEFVFIPDSDITNIYENRSNDRKEKQQKINYDKKLGSNLTGLIVFGDLNITYESPVKIFLKNKFSNVITAHYIFNGELNDQKTDFRFTYGKRLYISEFKKKREHSLSTRKFLQFKL